jgi:hypothetical protein
VTFITIVAVTVVVAGALAYNRRVWRPRQADLVSDPQLRDTIRRQVVCYATSVVHQDWPAMSRRRVSSVPTYWATLVRDAGVRLVRAQGGSTAGESLVARDGERATARQNRLGEARPTVPNALDWLMLATVVVLLAVLGAATQAAVDTRIHVTLVVAAAILFAATLLLISDLDQPYAGAIRRDPTQTEFHPEPDRAAGARPAGVRPRRRADRGQRVPRDDRAAQLRL